jgi:endoglucanase
MKSTIKTLVETTSPSGYEGPIRSVITSLIEQSADEVTVDALGNLVARKGSLQPGGSKIMLAAHMDEIGLIASFVDENGFVRFYPIGGVNPLTCLGGRVRFLTGSQGVIGMERLADPQRTPSLERLYIDLGAASREDCPVKVGDLASFERPFLDLGNRLVAKSMDDRIGVALLVECLNQMSSQRIQSPHEVYFVFSTQEEVGTRGAATAVYGLDPDIGLSVDVTGCGDTPKAAPMAIALGKGPAIKVRDGGMLSDPRIVRWMVSAAEAAKLPYQLEVLEGGTTDARAMQLGRSGVPVGCLSIPCRYIHSPSEMVDYSDVQNGVALLLELVSKRVDLGSL